MHRAVGGALCTGSNLVIDGHTDSVVGLDLVPIAVNHKAVELVVDLDRLADVVAVNGPNGVVFSSGATTALGAPTGAFPATVARGRQSR